MVGGDDDDGIRVRLREFAGLLHRAVELDGFEDPAVGVGEVGGVKHGSVQARARQDGAGEAHGAHFRLAEIHAVENEIG